MSINYRKIDRSGVYVDQIDTGVIQVRVQLKVASRIKNII